MFEVRCIVGDKKLTQVLMLLDGNTLEPPVVLPVKGSVQVAAKVVANGHDKDKPSSIDVLRKFIPGHKRVTSMELRQHCEANGYSKNGYSYALSKLLEEGALKKTREPRVYEVVR